MAGAPGLEQMHHLLSVAGRRKPGREERRMNESRERETEVGIFKVLITFPFDCPIFHLRLFQYFLGSIPLPHFKKMQNLLWLNV